MVSHVNSNKSTDQPLHWPPEQQERSRGRNRCRNGLGGGASQPQKQKSQLFIFGYGMESFKWIILDIPLLGSRATKESFIFLFKSLVCSLLKYHINQHVLRPNNTFQASHNSWRIQVPEVDCQAMMLRSLKASMSPVFPWCPKGLVLKATVFKYLV